MGHRKGNEEEAMWTKDEETWLEMKMELNTNKIISAIQTMMTDCKENRECKGLDLKTVATKDDLKAVQEEARLTTRKNLQTISLVALAVVIVVSTLGGPTAMIKLVAGRAFGLILN